MKKCCLTCACGKVRYLPQRYLLSMMCLLAVLVCYGQRVSLNLAITVMTDTNSTRSNSCPPRNTSMTKGPKKNITGGIIDWTNTEQNWIIGGFFTGYFIAHVPAGSLCDMYGGRPVLLGGIVMSTIITVASPVAINNLPFFVIVLMRIAVGVAQAVLYPAMSSLFSRWVPLEERALLGAFSMAASSMGVVTGNMITGGLLHFTHNWPITFYAWALIGIAWSTAFFLYVYSEPGTHPRITTMEKEMLLSKIVPPSPKMRTPWFRIMISLPVWGLIMGEIGHGFTIYTLMNSMPKYLSDVLQYEITDNAILSALPYTTVWFGGVGAGKLADWLIKERDYSIIWIRRIMTTIGLGGSAAFLVVGGYMGCSGPLVVIMFAIGMALKGPFFAGLKVNHLENTVNFPGTIMALYNGIGAISGQISPIMISYVAANNTLEEWAIVYWIIFLITAATNVFYCVVCTDKRLKWDIPPDEREAYARTVEEEKGKRAERIAKRKEAKRNKAAKE